MTKHPRFRGCFLSTNRRRRCYGNHHVYILRSSP
nr:MAG TPA: hypothetical protein [Inoviridae sp.]